MINFIAKKYFKYQFESICMDQKIFYKKQEKLWKKRRGSLKGTEVYKDCKLEHIISFDDYVNHLPLTTWNDYEKYSNRIINGEKNVLFKDEIEYFGLTSGTSGQDSKRIPYNKKTIDLFLRAQKYTASAVTYNSNVNLLTAKRMTFGSSPVSYSDNNFKYGYISGILSTKTPSYLKKNTFPSVETLKMDKWDEKIDNIIKDTINEDIEVVSGIPTYMITIFEAILEKTGKEKIIDLWPNMNAFIYGATPITQYKDRLNELIGRDIQYFGIYAATESPIGISYNENTYIPNPDLLYTFTPLGNESTNISVLDLKVGEEYCINIGIPNGMLNYSMNDVIRVISLDDAIEFEIIGRKNTGMNLAAEKVSELQILETIVQVRKKHNLDIRHFFVSPEMNEGRPRYLWTLFVPSIDGQDQRELEKDLDETLKKVCADYKDCRDDNVIMGPKVSFLNLEILEVYFKQNQHKGQFKMKTSFPAQSIFEMFLGELKKAAAC